MSIQTVAEQFTKFYYDTFDRNRADLQPLYRPESMLTFEGGQIQGVNGIIEKLTSLPFQKVAHRLSTVDAQPSSPNGASIVVTVTGQLLIDDETNAQMFTQTFNLIAEGQSFWVFNDIFRLNYA
ncbi:Nuclear transport factor 2 [Umbelopsis nana]